MLPPLHACPGPGHVGVPSLGLWKLPGPQCVGEDTVRCSRTKRGLQHPREGFQGNPMKSRLPELTYFKPQVLGVFPLPLLTRPPLAFPSPTSPSPSSLPPPYLSLKISSQRERKRLGAGPCDLSSQLRQGVHNELLSGLNCSAKWQSRPRQRGPRRTRHSTSSNHRCYGEGHYFITESALTQLTHSSVVPCLSGVHRRKEVVQCGFFPDSPQLPRGQQASWDKRGSQEVISQCTLGAQSGWTRNGQRAQGGCGRLQSRRKHTWGTTQVSRPTCCASPLAKLAFPLLLFFTVDCCFGVQG